MQWNFTTEHLAPKTPPWESHLLYVGLKWPSFTHTCTFHSSSQLPLTPLCKRLSLVENEDQMCVIAAGMKRPGCTCDVWDERIIHMTRQLAGRTSSPFNNL